MTPELSRRVGAVMNAGVILAEMERLGPSVITKLLTSAENFEDLPPACRRLILDAEEELGKEAE